MCLFDIFIYIAGQIEPKMKVEKVYITPGKAETLLRNNIKNRCITSRSLQRIVNQMKNGEWQEDTGETIKIASDGTLLDGQHRLTALIETGKSFNFLVISDLPNKAFEVIDTGKARNAGDALKILGVKNYYALSALIRQYLYLKAEKILNKQNDAVVTTSKIVECYNERNNYWNNISKRAHYLYVAAQKILTQSFIGGWYSYLSEFFQDETELFFQKLCSGINILDDKDPIKILRDELYQNKISDKKITVSYKNAILIVTWNSYLLNKKYSVIPYRYNKDPFPKIIKSIDEIKKKVSKDIND